MIREAASAAPAGTLADRTSVFQDGAHVFREVGAPRCGARNEVLLQARAFRPLDAGQRYGKHRHALAR